MSPQERFRPHSALYLVLEKGDKLLLQRRHNTGYNDGNYGMVSGHLDGGETVKDAMIREAKEEAGITIKSDDMRVVHVMHHNANKEYIDWYIHATQWEGNIKIMEADKCDDLSWFSFESLPENIIPSVAHAIDCIRKEEWYSEFGW